MFVYILKCADNTLYTGIAADVEKRLRQHLGLIKGGAKYTKSHKVRCIAAIWEDKENIYARSLEYKLKKLTRNQKQMLLENTDIPFTDLGIDIPRESFVYINPQQINEKYNLSPD